MKLITSELIPVYETDTGEKVVDGRELHEYLTVSSKFADWIKNRISKYGYEEDQDFTTVSKILENGGKIIDYILKLDVAKEICMVENNEKGSQARKYFIEVEKRFKAQNIDVGLLSPEMQMFKHMFDGVAKMQIQAAETQHKLAAVETTVQVIQETLLQRDEDWRNSINSMLNAAAFRMGGVYRDLRSESYRVLEDRAHCDLNTRLRNLKERLTESGATKTKVNDSSRMDIIEADPKLREIYTTIVKEMSIGSLKIAK